MNERVVIDLNCAAFDNAVLMALEKRHWCSTNLWGNYPHSKNCDAQGTRSQSADCQPKGAQMKVLSLFDGISCGRVALERAGIPVEKYYASEIDRYAISVAQAMYPDTIQVGDVNKLNYLELLDVDMIIGGSPCQDLSIAKQNRQGLRGERSGLFWKYVEALETIRPKYFLLENVASMKNEDRDAITATLSRIYPETECIMINSALVSAQQRKRYYWTNWHVEQPQDKGILLKDILESGLPYNNKAHCLRAGYAPYFEHDLPRKKDEMVAEPVPCAMRTREDELGRFKRLETKDDGKANSLTSVQTDSMVDVNIDNYFRKYGTKGKIMSADTEKTQCLTASMGCGGNNPLVAEPVILQRGHGYNTGGIKKDKSPTLTSGAAWEQNNKVVEPVRIGELDGLGKGQANRIYSVRGKSVCLNTLGGGGGAKTGLYKIDLPDGDYIVRKLTPRECARLQTYPERCFDVANISNTQWYKAFGNGWTVDVIAHIFSLIPGTKGGKK